MIINSHLNLLKTERLMSSTYSIHIKDNDGVWDWYCYVKNEKDMEEVLNRLIKLDNVETIRVTFDVSVKLFDAEPFDIPLDKLSDILKGDDNE